MSTAAAIGLGRRDDQGVWCDWCRDHSRHLDPNTSAVTNVIFEWLDSDPPRQHSLIQVIDGIVHLHGLYIAARRPTYRDLLRTDARKIRWLLRRHRVGPMVLGAAVGAAIGGVL